MRVNAMCAHQPRHHGAAGAGGLRALYPDYLSALRNDSEAGGLQAAGTRRASGVQGWLLARVQIGGAQPAVLVAVERRGVSCSGAFFRNFTRGRPARRSVAARLATPCLDRGTGAPSRLA